MTPHERAAIRHEAQHLAPLIDAALAEADDKMGVLCTIDAHGYWTIRPDPSVPVGCIMNEGPPIRYADPGA